MAEYFFFLPSADGILDTNPDLHAFHWKRNSNAAFIKHLYIAEQPFLPENHRFLSIAYFTNHFRLLDLVEIEYPLNFALYRTSFLTLYIWARNCRLIKDLFFGLGLQTAGVLAKYISSPLIGEEQKEKEIEKRIKLIASSRPPA